MMEGYRETPHRRNQDTPPKLPDVIDDIDDAREYVAERIAEGVRPMITIPEEHVEDALAYGIGAVPKHDLLTDRKFSFVAGVIGLEPYLPEGETRRVFAVDPSRVRIEPRFTGEDRAFHGVVGFPDGVPASALIPLGAHSKGTWDEEQEMRKGPIQ